MLVIAHVEDLFLFCVGRVSSKKKMCRWPRARAKKQEKLGGMDEKKSILYILKSRQIDVE